MRWSGSRIGPRRNAGIALALAVGVLTALPASVARAAEPAGRPDILIVLTDDQRWDTLRYLPAIRKRLVSRGVMFTEGLVPNPVCCPSRVTTLTGLYSHDTDVWNNIDGEEGGFTAFDDRVSIATVLRDQGYRTALIGKYLNGYPRGRFEYKPPGWSYWFAVGTGVYYDYNAAVNGRKVHFGDEPRDYIGRVLTKRAIRFVGRAERDGRPFFLLFAHTAPHHPAIPDRRDEGVYGSIAKRRPPSYGNEGVSDGSPEYIREMPWNREIRLGIDTFRKHQLETLAGVDRNVSRLMRAIPSNTLVIFLSDNGFLWGEHRWSGKTVPYEESIRVPFVVRWKGQLPAGVTSDRMVMNGDIAPTILEAVGLDPSTPTGISATTGEPVQPDGSSFLGGSPRDSLVLEHYGRASKNAVHLVPSYCGVRTARYMFTRYATGERELYDLSSDPYELVNLVEADPGVAEELMTLAQDLCDPPPPGFSWTP